MEVDNQTTSLLATPQIKKLLFPEVTLARVDSLTEAVVEEGIRVLESKGIREAALFASKHNVPLIVAKRVLLRPWERRGAKA